MKFNHLRRDSGLTKADLEEMSVWLVDDLSRYLGTKLHYFKRYIVDTESFNITVQGAIQEGLPLGLRIEGIIFMGTGIDNPPTIGAEILLFIDNERAGLRGQQGKSVLLLRYEDDKGWCKQFWMGDDLEYWESVTKLRSAEYDSFDDVWENNYE